MSVVLLIGPEADRALCSQHSLGIVSAAAAGLLVVGVVCCAVVAAGAVAVVVVSRGPPLDLRKPDIDPGCLCLARPLACSAFFGYDVSSHSLKIGARVPPPINSDYFHGCLVLFSLLADPSSRLRPGSGDGYKGDQT